MDNRFIITITRECGSRGEAIAKSMAKLLGIRLYNYDIIHQASQHYDISGLLSSGEKLIELKKKRNRLVNRVFFPGINGNTAAMQVRFSEREKIMQLVAENENCIFMGNYADFTFHDCPYALHLYIYAPYEKRISNYMEDLELDYDEARSMVNTADEAMSYGYETFTGYAPDAKEHKHVMVDSSVLGVEETAEMLVDMIKRKISDNWIQ